MTIVKLYIKYMVSLRCKLFVKEAMDNLGIRHGEVNLGEAEIVGTLTKKQTEQLRKDLLAVGLELMDDKKAILIEKIKTVIVEMIHYAEEFPRVKNSSYLSEKLHLDYTYLSNTFSETTGITIEHFIIHHKIERAKEFLIYNELNLTEISYKLNYSSVAHLSAQFKKITGLTPSYFKKLRYKKRFSIDKL